MIDVTGPALIASNHHTRGLFRRLLSKEHRRASSDLKIGLLSGVAQAGLNDRYQAQTSRLKSIPLSHTPNKERGRSPA
ncbi:hypothetical protein [Mesorhizobium sp. ORS 3428]|uniref:hypothetical protein n=1 Tax=Mesorhizobium sp. ORS 3428 TaxID=540997 RepID=UPI001042845E|nr:hypothetical protein [Mesorhizobium sp. ORS 3428]